MLNPIGCFVSLFSLRGVGDLGAQIRNSKGLLVFSLVFFLVVLEPLLTMLRTYSYQCSGNHVGCWELKQLCVRHRHIPFPLYPTLAQKAPFFDNLVALCMVPIPCPLPSDLPFLLTLQPTHTSSRPLTGYSRYHRAENGSAYDPDMSWVRDFIS